MIRLHSALEYRPAATEAIVPWTEHRQSTNNATELIGVAACSNATIPVRANRVKHHDLVDLEIMLRRSASTSPRTERPIRQKNGLRLMVHLLRALVCERTVDAHPRGLSDKYVSKSGTS